jgi:hypothetical protein
MPPRRKTGDAAADGAEAPKKRKPRAKKVSVIVPQDELNAPPPIVVPPFKADQPAPQVVKTPSAAPPVSIKIEPMAAPAEDRWSPPKKEDPDLKMPPPVLLQKKRMPTEVEDILEEPEMDDGSHVEEKRDLLRPNVKTGLYRKLGIGFAVLTVLVLLVVGYVTYSQATVIVHPKRVEIATERVLSVVAEPSSADEIEGEIFEVTVAGEKTAAPAALTAAGAGTAAPEPLIDAVAEGRATIINESLNPITLIPKTRLLSKDGVLFRMKSRATVPAGGKLDVDVYADVAGKSGNIGPSNFTIPGLSAEQQTVIYAKSAVAMTGGQKTASGAAAVGSADDGAAVTAQELESLEAALKTELLAQAKEELAKKSGRELSGEILDVENISRYVNVLAGDTTDKIVIRLTLQTRLIRFDKVRAVEAAVSDLKRGLTSDRELLAVNGDDAVITVEGRPNVKNGTASIRLAIRGESSISLSSPLFDAKKLEGLDLEAVRVYFEGIEGVERVDVNFRPFFVKRMPDLADHIKFKIAE